VRRALGLRGHGGARLEGRGGVGLLQHHRRRCGRRRQLLEGARRRGRVSGGGGGGRRRRGAGFLIGVHRGEGGGLATLGRRPHHHHLVVRAHVQGEGRGERAARYVRHQGDAVFIRRDGDGVVVVVVVVGVGVGLVVDTGGGEVTGGGGTAGLRLLDPSLAHGGFRGRC